MKENEENIRISFDNEENLIRMWSKGKMVEENTKEVIGQLLELMDKHPGVDLLVDAREMSTANAAARELWGDFLKNHDQRTAMVGANRVIRVATGLVFGAAGRGDDVKLFKTEEEAINWLHEE